MGSSLLVQPGSGPGDPCTLLLGLPSGKRGVSEAMLGIHAVDHTLFIDHSGIIKTCDLCSLSSLERDTVTMHQMHLCSEHIIPASSLRCLEGEPLPQAPPSSCAQMGKLRPGRG